MQVRGLHLLLTYKCNARCRHCFLNSGPDRAELYSPAFAREIVAEAVRIASVDHIFIEGGEPFLYPELMLTVIDRASEAGIWVGALTNGFWAVSKEKARDVLKPLIAAGLQSLSLSTDAWHEEFVPAERVETARVAAEALGIETDIMICRAADVVCRGRASSALCSSGALDWESLTVCGERLQSPGRVHIGPSGEIHLCQGLLIGTTAAARPLGKILADYKAEKHPIAARLIKGGPAELARFAAEYGWQPQPGYTDGCQLCFEVRRYLRRRFPRLIGPKAVFAA